MPSTVAAATLNAATCHPGHVLKDATTCEACTSVTVLKAASGTDALFTPAGIKTCGITGTTYSTVTSLSCLDGYFLT